MLSSGMKIESCLGLAPSSSYRFSPTDHLPCLGNAGLNSLAIREKVVEHLSHGYAIASAELSKADVVSLVNLYGLKR